MSSWPVFLISIVFSAATAFPASALLGNVLLEKDAPLQILILSTLAFAYPIAATLIAGRAWYLRMGGQALGAIAFWTGLISGSGVAVIFALLAFTDKGDALLWIPIACGGLLLVCTCLISVSTGSRARRI